MANALFPIVVIPLLNTIVLRLVQFEKPPCSIVVNVFGKVMEPSAVLLKKALDPIVPTIEFDREDTFFKTVKPEKVEGAILFIEPGRTMVTREAARPFMRLEN